jgi:hypothetical protein
MLTSNMTTNKNRDNRHDIKRAATTATTAVAVARACGWVAGDVGLQQPTGVGEGRRNCVLVDWHCFNHLDEGLYTYGGRPSRVWRARPGCT